jgi:hypothetical protein
MTTTYMLVDATQQILWCNSTGYQIDGVQPQWGDHLIFVFENKTWVGKVVDRFIDTQYNRHVLMLDNVSAYNTRIA